GLRAVGSDVPIDVHTNFSAAVADPGMTGLLPSNTAQGAVLVQPRQLKAPPYRPDDWPADAPSIPVSNDPETRLLQVASFYRRNPGFMRTEGVTPRIVAKLAELPLVGRAYQYVRATGLGVGQVTYDQMRWMIDRGALVDDPWWIKGNTRIIGDALSAEALVRSGGDAAAIDNVAIRGWVDYIKASDAVVAAMGVQPGGAYTKAGAVDDLTTLRPDGALSDAYKGVSLLERAKVRFDLMPRARMAFWKAHEHSALMHQAATPDEFAELQAKYPDEGEFAKGWLKFIGAHRVVNLPTAGHGPLLFQHAALPDTYPVVNADLTPGQRAFAWLTRHLPKQREA
ncbi:MAG: hypothetical protein JWN72_208, partial [Thermoleophilia bacterium]|nr:hypothetical protein [Thermoleophilia bacterium]